MCLVLFAVDPPSDHAFVMLSNRDESFARPTARASFWSDAPHVLAGRDLEKGGTWAGVTRDGRIACVTNVRSTTARITGRSRGSVVAGFLRATHATPGRYAAGLAYAELPSHNALFVDAHETVYANEEGVVGRVEPGVHGLSNARLDDPWPKVARGKRALSEWIRNRGTVDEALALLADETLYDAPELPKTGVAPETERALSSAFIHALRPVGYGTRASTVVLVGRDGMLTFVERTFDERGETVSTTRFDFAIERSRPSLRSPLR